MMGYSFTAYRWFRRLCAVWLLLLAPGLIVPELVGFGAVAEAKPAREARPRETRPREARQETRPAREARRIERGSGTRSEAKRERLRERQSARTETRRESFRERGRFSDRGFARTERRQERQRLRTEQRRFNTDRSSDRRMLTRERRAAQPSRSFSINRAGRIERISNNNSSRNKLGKNVIRSGSAAASRNRLNFGNSSTLASHFQKHGKEFGAATAKAYLKVGRDIARTGYKVRYNYKGERRTGYIAFMGNSSRGEAKFGFVGTNRQGVITTIHTKNGADAWKMLNGNQRDKNIRIAR